MATKKKKVRSHVKRVKLQQKKNPVSQEKYEKRLKVARKKDFFRRLRNVILILAIAFCALFAAGNLMLKKATGQTLIGCMREAKDLVDSSTPDTFRLAQTSYIYSDDGTQLAALAESEDATYLSYEDIPQMLSMRLCQWRTAHSGITVVWITKESCVYVSIT